METKNIVSSCSVSKEQEIQQLQEKAQLSKGGCMKGLKALQSHFTSISDDLKDFGQQHTEQPEIINEGRVDQYTEECQIKSLMLDSSLDYKTTKFSKQSLEFENICLKKIVAQFQRMEAHCIALELKYQNQSVKSGQHG
ncbi:hypothetical protein Tco_1004624 [Tanacetum coccineum]|uniref:Uncharacterized protein n=1 Tax=Tanacetum coccineum TaxID=301880 RepID=A0ABQ5FCT9_9ASTR